MSEEKEYTYEEVWQSRGFWGKSEFDRLLRLERKVQPVAQEWARLNRRWCADYEEVE